MGLFENRRLYSSPANSENKVKKQLPIWFMRQAGRYHSHYQNIKKKYDFVNMCKRPEVAAEVTLGPVLEFDLDAAILFSDILFPLEHLGMGLRFDDRLGPILNKKIKSIDDSLVLEKNFQTASDTNTTSNFFKFQGEALEIIKNKLPPHITLIGFVGAPFTLYAYALEESLSKGRDLLEAKKGLYDGRYEHFTTKLLLPLLFKNISVQIEAGAEAIALFDTASGYLNYFDYQQFLVPPLKELLYKVKAKYSNTKIIYYSKYTTEDQLKALALAITSEIDVLAIDFRFDLLNIFNNFIANNNFQNIKYIQGNIDPFWPMLDWEILKSKIDNLYAYLERNQSTNSDLSYMFDRWIFGLGHGILKETPEENIKKLVKYIQEKFAYNI
ncbi:MAG: hypothetical protein HQK51_17060 [Oligoflexia bacterium]|nr:hypothetical protein [Oligoflexia bacterium]